MSVNGLGGLGAYEGYLDIANCNLILGWAWDDAHPDAPVSVDIFDNGVLATTVPASVYRADLVGAGKGTGAHGFTYTPALNDGKPHVITARVAGAGFTLLHDQPAFTCAVPPPPPAPTPTSVPAPVPNPIATPVTPPVNALAPAANAVAVGTPFTLGGLSLPMLALIGGGIFLLMNRR